MFRLRTLGSVDLRGPDGAPVEGVLAQPKRLALLIFLAASRPAGMHRRDDLLARFWPDLDDARARDALNQALRFLRQALGAETVVGRGADEVGIDPSRVWCDVIAFRESLATGRTTEAMELFQGEFLPGYFVEEGGGFEAWMDSVRTELREAAALGARELAERDAEAGAFTRAIVWGRRALELAPDDERALRRLLRWYDGAGDRAGAFRAYEAFAKRFAEEFGSPLSPETKDLVERLRTGRPLGEPSSPPAGREPLAGLGDRYRIERKLGAGGMATVYLARDRKHDREVALKVLRPEVAEGLARERFLREIRIAGRLQHPNIVPLFDSGEADGRLFYVMPHVQGETMRDRLRREGKLPVDEVVHLLREIAGALAYAHDRGVVHRDIKPENILLIDRRAVLADFGIARAAAAARTPAESGDYTLTQTGTSLGTPAYMAPEQVAGGGDVDHRADLYALGVVGYEMLAGRTPFAGGTAQELLAAQLTERPRPLAELRPEIPAHLAALVMRCLEKPPAQRPQSAAELLAGLDPGRPEAATSPARAPRHRVLPAGGARKLGYALLAVAVAGVGIREVARSGPGPAAPGGASPDALSHLAVLYFEDRSPDGSLRWLARGLTEDLIDALAGVSGLTVTSRNGVRPYEGKAESPQRLGRALSVGLLIDGTVEASPDSVDGVNLVVRLVDARTGVQLERETLTRTARQPGVLRRDLARLVELSLRRRIGAHVQLRADRQAAGSDAAWELLRRARELRSEALQLEPGPAQVRLRLADSLLATAEGDSAWIEPTVDRASLALVHLVAVPAGDSAAAVLREGISRVEGALRRAPRSARAFAIRGVLRLRLVQFGPPGGTDTLLAAAREDLLRATALDPAQATAWYALMDVEQFLGHEDESYLAGRKALAADIYATEAPRVLAGLMLQALGRPDRAAADSLCAMGRLNFPANPNFQSCGFTILGWLGTDRPAVAEAERQLRELDTLPGHRPTREYRHMLFAALLARAGLADSARAVARRVTGVAGGGDSDSAVPVYQANLELLLGNRDRALRILERYAGSDPVRRLSLRGHPWFRDLRGDPRFQRATAEVK